MALAEISFFSKSLDMSSRMNVLLPEAVEGRRTFPVFYLLHGLSSDSTTWLRKTSIERYVSKLPLIVVMPETGRGWYTNSALRPLNGFAGAYEDHFLQDVVPFVDRMFPTIARREGRVIGGLSMGATAR